MTEPELRTLLADRVAALEGRVAAACRRAGRARGEITVVAVTKTVPARVAALLPELGVFDLGESRPQELWRKAAALPASVRWHQVGHLQRNKVARTLPLVCRVHSVDSVRLLGEIAKEAARQQLPPVPVFLEVNMSREPAKHGFAPEEVPGLPRSALGSPHVRIEGLMTMAAYADDPEQARPTFRALRELRDRLREEWGDLLAAGHLSMGMSGDFEVAIEEGATFIRPGTILFEGIPADA